MAFGKNGRKTGSIGVFGLLAAKAEDVDASDQDQVFFEFFIDNACLPMYLKL